MLGDVKTIRDDHVDIGVFWDVEGVTLTETKTVEISCCTKCKRYRARRRVLRIKDIVLVAECNININVMSHRH